MQLIKFIAGIAKEVLGCSQGCRDAMPKDIESYLGAFVRNTFRHMGQFLSGRDTLGEVLGALVRDIRKFKRFFRFSGSPKISFEARRLVEKGRQHYNRKQYEQAETLFRDAIIEDESYALAHTYLGYVLYKQQRLQEAALYWQQAIEIAPKSEAARKAGEKLRVLRSQKGKIDAWLEDYKDP